MRKSSTDIPGLTIRCIPTSEGPFCAHGFMVLSETCDFFYKVTAPYNPQADRSLRWNDPDLAIDWPIEIGLEPIVSPKDAAAASFADCEKSA